MIRHDGPTQNQLRLSRVYFNINGLWINVIAFTFTLTASAVKSFNIAFQNVRIRLSTHKVIGYPCGTRRIKIVIIVLFRCGQTNLRRQNNTIRTFRKRYHNCCSDLYNKYYSDNNEQYQFACEYGNRIWHEWCIFFFVTRLYVGVALSLCRPYGMSVAIGIFLSEGRRGRRIPVKDYTKRCIESIYNFFFQKITRRLSRPLFHRAA